MNEFSKNFFIIIAAIAVSGISTNAQTVGYVAEIRGEWYLNGNTLLRQGQPLPAAGKINTKSANRYDSIKIADLNGRIRQECNQTCSFTLPKPASKPGYLEAAWSTVMAFVWSSSKNRYTIANARGGAISIGIVKLDESKINLSSLVNIQGQNFLRWRKLPLKEEEKPGDWSEPKELNTENDAADVSSTDFNVGLYEFSLLRKMGNSMEPTDSALILISSPKTYEQDKKSFAEFEKSVWELTKPNVITENGKKEELPGIKSETALLFLHGYLDKLARERAN